MNAQLSEIYQNILKGTFEGQAMPEKKGLISFFTGQKTDEIGQYAKPFYEALQQGIYGGQYATNAAKFVTDNVKNTSVIFQLSSKDFQSLANRSHVNSIAIQNIIDWAENLVDRGWIAGERQLFFRFIPLILGFNAGARWAELIAVIGKIPVDYRKEFFLICALGIQKNAQFKNLLFFVLSSIEQHIPLSDGEQNLLFELLEKGAIINFNGLLPKVAKVYLALSKECKEAIANNSYQDFSKKTYLDFQTAAQISELSDNEQKAFGELIRIVSDGGLVFRGIYHLDKSILAHIEETVTLSEIEMAQQIRHLIASEGRYNIPETTFETIKKNGSKLLFSQDLFEAVWDMFFFFTYRQDAKSLEKIIRQQVSLRLTSSGQAVSWESLLWSGFRQLPIPSNHSPYFGLHPDQVRPFFQLMRAVAEVDIIKIYKVGKLYQVRFMFFGETYDLPTGDGFGVGCMPQLNTLLYEKGMPYQLVVLEADVFGPVPTRFYKPKIVTLMDEATYHLFQHKIASQNLAGFAKNSAVAPIFLKNIDELKKVETRPDLDVVRLEDDPKFSAIREQMQKLEPLDMWTKFLRHCLKYPLDGKPSATWQKEARTIIDEMPNENFRKGLALVVDNMIKGDEWFSDDEKICGLRGLTWACRLHTDASLRFLLQRIANKAYKKVSGGPLNAKLGNLAMEGLVVDGTLHAFGALGNLKAKAKYPVFVRAIASAMKKFESLLKQFSAAELQDRVIPEHELTNGQKRIQIGSFEANLQLEGLKVKLTWLNEKGKEIASIPTELKRDFAVELQAIKAELKSIEETIQAQSARLENSWIENRSWSLPFWLEFYRTHELMGALAQKLVWQLVSEDDNTLSFLPSEQGNIASNGGILELPETGTVRLWHPALAASVQEVGAWRNLLFDKKLVQPFKQAFREVYLITPAEEASVDQSLRFAGHFLRGNTLYSLGKNRAWTMTYDQPPLRKIPEADIVAELGISGGVLYSECQTLALTFHQLGAAKQYEVYRQPKLPLKQVPPTILSEIMRDVDLFVAVSNIGIDPYFDQKNSGELLDYWRNVSFGEKSKTSIAEIRSDLLQRLLPMTKIAKQCKLEGNYLHVNGKIRSYKINLSSANILMQPNDQYLCIVASNNAKLEKQIWLPFEGGDHVLMLILSKAFLLADDDKITDQSILQQLKK